jgi:D-sedoheptulose 7-phosphate isomerase
MNELFARGLDDHARLIQRLDEQLPLLDDIARAIVTAIEDGHRVYILGNGGSAADAQHIAAEFVGRFKRQRRALPAVALTTDSSNLLSIGNDYGFAHVFARQVEALVRPGDVVWVLSTSGNSPNVIEAAQIARGIEACVIGFTGKSGGRLKPLCDHCFCVEHESSDRIQEVHQTAYHLICEVVEQHFADHSGA